MICVASFLLHSFGIILSYFRLKRSYRVLHGSHPYEKSLKSLVQCQCRSIVGPERIDIVTPDICQYILEGRERGVEEEEEAKEEQVEKKS